MMSYRANSGQVPPRLNKPDASRRKGQPFWNSQRGSSMPFARYGRDSLADHIRAGSERSWPAGSIDFAPLWCSVDLRDGNQALPNPMDSGRKLSMFELLVDMGFKEIEVGYPAASETDFEFVRQLIRGGHIPDDVTISVFTPARPELIDRTFESLVGADRALVHLCMATACLWREVVFSMSMNELAKYTLFAAERVARRADELPGMNLRFEYSPETFNATEPEFALRVSNEVAASWDACPDRPVTLNLPSTVEVDSPNVYADQIEWMHRNLDNRESLILSVHPHNDRGTAVAAAELALQAGAERVEGTLFGNGERTGNVCLGTLALNLFSRGVDPQLDFSDIDGIRHVVESCTQMPVHPRHPYVGELVYTAFSGTHQDAIAKGFVALAERSQQTGVTAADISWEIPYLPIDPKDVGRTYESVVRLNSQSGKGGVSHVILSKYGLDMPRGLRIEFSRLVQKATEETGLELNSFQLWDLFKREYLKPEGRPVIEEVTTERLSGSVRVNLHVGDQGQGTAPALGQGDSLIAAVNTAIASTGRCFRLRSLTAQNWAESGGSGFVAYAESVKGEISKWGVAAGASEAEVMLMAAGNAIQRLLRDQCES
jgi:2-isopropylmalate synthase